MAKNVPALSCGRCALFEPRQLGGKVVGATIGKCQWRFAGALPIALTSGFAPPSLIPRSYVSADTTGCPTFEAQT